MEPKLTLNENVNPYKALYNVYEEMYNPDVQEEGIFDRAANRIKGAVAGGKAAVGNVANKVTNAASNVRTMGHNIAKGAVNRDNEKRNLTQATQVDSANAKKIAQIEHLSGNFVNDAIKLKLMAPGYKEVVGLVIETLMCVSLGVKVPTSMKATIEDAFQRAVGLGARLEYFEDQQQSQQQPQQSFDQTVDANAGIQ